jgi:hypothetical protein
VAKEELNLFQLPACGAAEPSAGSTKIVRCEFVHANLGGELLDDVPDELLRDPFAPNLPSAAHVAEEATAADSSGFDPVIQETPHPARNRDCSNVTCFSTEVYNCPMALTLLKVTEGKLGEFVASKSAGEQ